MVNIYTDIKNPEELFEFMNENISYGYLGGNNHIYKFGDINYDKDWLKEYILENKDDILKSKVGTCWDQVEFERDWFEKNKYEFKTIYHQVILNYDNPYPTHTFLIYKENEKWYWFENAWEDMKGIHEFDTIDELYKYEYNEYLQLLKKYNITLEEIPKITYYEYSKPQEHLTAENFVNYVTKENKIAF